jgi:DNA-binding MarR family transcriptional regulator
MVAVLSTGNELLREAGRLFKPHGLTAAQFNVLNLLSDEPNGLRPSDLTTALVVDPSSTTYLLDRMEQLGWLERVDHAEDRRAYRIELTTAGRELHRKVAPLYLTALRATMAGLPKGQVAAMTDALIQMQQAARGAVDAVLRDSAPKLGPARGKRV